MSFFIKNVLGGLMSDWLGKVVIGDVLEMIGLLGSFYLCLVNKFVLMLVGGIGLVLFFVMLEEMVQQGVQYLVYLIYGVICDQDLVLVECLEDIV